MAINKAMRAALKALSYPDIEISKTYKIDRSLKELSSKVINPLYKAWDHVVYCEGREVPVRLFFPDEAYEITGCPVLLFFHGGGWVTGNIDSYTRVCANMAKLTGSLVVSVDYRLAPEHPFPAAPEDCYAVAREIISDSQLLKINPGQLTLIGDSAGGNIAAAVSLMARDRGEFSIRRQILIYPATYNDHTPSSPFESVVENGTDYLLTSKHICEYMQLYMGSPKDRTNPYFAPLLAENLKNQPETLIITAEYDPLRDEGEAYGRKLAAAGNKVELHRMPDALHGFFSLPVKFELVRQSYDIINQFLKKGSIS